MSRVVCRRGLARGALSAAFSAEELLAALREDDAHLPYLYVEPDGAGGLAPAPPAHTSAGLGAARLCVRARLAPSAPQRTADVLLQRGALRLRVAEGAAPHAELLLWPDAPLCRALHLPHLTPRDLSPAGLYACRRCGAAFADPNPLKLHLFLRCRPALPTPAAFWREAAARLCAPPPPPPPPLVDAAQFEALAAEWGRGAGEGHECVFCGRRYSRRYGLRIHLRTHTGRRPLRCGVCARAFADPSNLNKHVRLHARRAEGRQ